MRIIAGMHRGRRILPPATDSTRPITDRVKQSLFDHLAPRIEGATVLDLFAGTGSMGLESLSRGAARATFFESDRSAVKVLRQNIDALKLTPLSTVISADLFKWFDNSAADPPLQADLVFLDPPYRFLIERPEDLRRLALQLAKRHLAPDAIVIFRHDGDDVLEMPALRRYDQRVYGSMMLEFLTASVAG
jgi:16S rRNA (guanine(966)-N(2))-methyltransferase RsmD